MRILHIDTGREMRGGQIQVLLLLAGLQEAGHGCLLLARARAPLWDAARDAGISVFPAGPTELWLRSKRVDLIHVHDAHAHTMAALTSRRPFVVSRRVAFPVKHSFPSQWKYRRARRFLAVSKFVAQELERANVPREKIDVVYDGVEARQQTANWNGSNPVVALASSDPRKGKLLVEQAAHIAGFPVVYSNDLPRDLMNASMFVYITQSEGLGSAALLAMSLGVPVIASRVGGLAEVFEDGVSGLYVNNDADEVARAMRTLRENPALAATLIAGGRERVSSMFSKERLISGTIDFYARALGS
ncbi:MAG TPA: glycosyltransferase family 4 protein [Bryobacteraceae bacterium]|nr:glycosyltransferase family 4 protein [Bryobacteraceae bacterium]